MSIPLASLSQAPNPPDRSVAAPPDHVTANLPFVLRIAREYMGHGLPIEDLFMEGVLGLLQAVDHFDPSRGTRFITYAVWWIRRAIMNAIACSTRQVRLPRYRSHQLREWRRRYDRLARDLGRPPEAEDLARSLGVPLEVATRRPPSWPIEVPLDHPLGGSDGRRPGDLLPSAGSSPEALLLSEETSELLGEALSALPARERSVLEARFGLGDRRVETLRELGARMGLTKERVRQIEVRAVRLLRARLEGRLTR